MILPRFLSLRFLELELWVVCPPYVSRQFSQPQRILVWELTFLHKLEAIGNAALVANKQETTTFLCRVGSLLVRSDLWAELDAPTHDAPLLVQDQRSAGLHVIAGVGLADVSGEWALEL
jgi:hypothetical protein